MRMKAAVLFLILALGPAAFGEAPEAPLPAPFRIQLGKADDSAAIAFTATSAVVTIVSRSGIGGATLVRSGERWPGRLTIRLGLWRLESFKMRNGILYAETSFNGAGNTPFWKAAREGTRPDTADGLMAVRMTQAGESFEIVMPAEMTAGNPKEIGFEWIDAYR